jgi:metal-responsive CopG/Arc/MetJ family transcriptional regulator
MERINLTLDDDTAKWLEKHARQAGTRRATLARELLREGLARREAVERRRQLAADYAADRSDAADLLAELETGQLELLDEETA